ncbi:spore cortex biosynthesis protein YabQ [Paenibacillus chartarius]|uniref:Spore cortex biosynthesis protein YabQ n=1 Tax=Paenibacillus chartarius TaxID=747481 RepID=A0ABV6DU59_9BACL
MTLNVQFLTLWMMFVSGLALGVLFDGFRVLAGQLRVPRWTQPVTDLLYWSLATILVFRILYWSNHGQVRLFVFIGLLIGVVIYFTSLSKAVISVMHYLIRTVKALFRFLVKTVETVVVKPIIGLYRLFILFLGFLAALAIFLYRIVLQCLYPFWKLLIWLTRPIWRPLQQHLRMPRWLARIGGWFERMWVWLRRWF